MKSLFAVILGMFVVLSFLAPAVLSQEAPTAGHNDTAVQNGFQGSGNGFNMYRSTMPPSTNSNSGPQDGFYLNQMGQANQSANSSTDMFGLPLLGGNGNACVGGAGGTSSGSSSPGMGSC